MADGSKDGEDRRAAGWEANRRAQLTLGLGVTPARQLQWLEEMIAFAHRTGVLPRRADRRG